MSHSGLTPPLDREDERYETLLQIASGGMATVYVGRQRGAGGFERLVAIKRLHPHLLADPEVASWFLDEAQIASLIHHPNVVSVHDVHESQSGERLLVMEYVDGVSLSVLERAASLRGVRVPRPAALRIAIDVLAGLHAAHEQRSLSGEPLNMVHRDATPQNIMLGADGAVKLTDFGIARFDARGSQTVGAEIKGKFRYLSPEQARGGRVDRRVDVFAMGAVLWEMLTGEPFIKADSDLDALRLISEAKWRAPHEVDRTVPQDLSAIVMKALAPGLEARFASAEEFGRALERWGRPRQQSGSRDEVARLVADLCGQALEERRAALREALGRRGARASIVIPTPAFALMPEASEPMMTTSEPSFEPPEPSTASPLTHESPSPLGDPSSVPDFRPRGRRAAAAALGASLLALGLFAGLLSLRGGEAAPAGASPADAARVTIVFSAEQGVREVRAPQIGDIAFTPSGASFTLPRSGEPVVVHVRLGDGGESDESVTPAEGLARQIGRPQGARPQDPPAAQTASPPLPPPEPAKPRDGDQGGDRSRPSAQPAKPDKPARPPRPALHKNPYE